MKEVYDKAQEISQRIEPKYRWKVRGKGKIIRKFIQDVQDSSYERKEKRKNSEKEIITDIKQ